MLSWKRAAIQREKHARNKVLDRVHVPIKHERDLMRRYNNDPLS